MGSLTERRSEALARVAPVLAGRRTRFLIHDGRVPVTHDGDGYVTGDEKHDLLAHTRLLLNVHRSKVPYFEWHRNMPAISNGCLVVTEPGESHDPLMPWEHFAVAPSDSFPEFVEMLLASPDVVHRLVHQGYDFVRHDLRLTDQLRALLPVCEDAAVTGPPTRRVMHYIASTGSQLVEDQGPLPAPNHLVAASTPAERVLKRSLMHQKKLARKIDELECRTATGADQHEEIIDNAAWNEARPEISIVIPVYNYERYVTQALGSAAGSRGLDVELVVIDDHSTDGSHAVVEKFQNDRPEVALRIVSLSVNTGLSAVRNRALDHVRADYVFFLDADNSVYPDALRTLHDALRDADDQTAFSYGMIRCFGEQDRLLSVYPWNVERLVRGNYIDAMVMMRRRVLDELGGFSLEMQNEHGGWEDYEMWLRTREQRTAPRSSCLRSSAAIECTAPRWSPPSTSTRSSHASTCATSTRAFLGRNWSWYPLTPDTVSPTTSAESAAAGVDRRRARSRCRSNTCAASKPSWWRCARNCSARTPRSPVSANGWSTWRLARGRCEARARRPHRRRARAGPPRGDEALPLRAASPRRALSPPPTAVVSCRPSPATCGRASRQSTRSRTSHRSRGRRRRRPA